MATFNFLKDMRPPFTRGALWPMRSTALMAIRDVVLSESRIFGTVEGGVCKGWMLTWNADGSCNNGDTTFQLMTPEERERQNQPKPPPPSDDWCD